MHDLAVGDVCARNAWAADTLLFSGAHAYTWPLLIAKMGFSQNVYEKKKEPS